MNVIISKQIAQNDGQVYFKHNFTRELEKFYGQVLKQQKRTRDYNLYFIVQIPENWLLLQYYTRRLRLLLFFCVHLTLLITKVT